MSSTPATSQTSDTSPRRSEHVESQLTPEQLAFAEVVGQRLAERWTKRHEPQAIEREDDRQPS